MHKDNRSVLAEPGGDAMRGIRLMTYYDVIIDREEHTCQIDTERMRTESKAQLLIEAHFIQSIDITRIQ